MLLAIPLTLVLSLTAPIDPAAEGSSSAILIRFAGDEVIAVVHADLTKLDAGAFLKTLVGKLAEADDVSTATKLANSWVAALKTAGARELFVLIDLTDLPAIPVVVIPLAEGADAKAIADILTRNNPGNPLRWPTTETISGALLAGTPAAIERIKNGKAKPRPQLALGLAAVANTSVRVVIVPSSVQRRSIEESMPNLPPQLGGGPITTITQGMTWAALGMVVDAKPSLRIMVQAKDAEAATSLKKISRDALDQLAKEVRKNLGDTTLATTIAQLEPKVLGDRLILEADLGNAAQLALNPIERMRESARRSQCTNNLKQIGLAMHNYHSTYNTFPPAYTASKEGKSLLSWRVHILPFLEQKALYEEFHLDEPWDSTHNKTLISRMPVTYACPSASTKLAREGKTSYLTPRGPATIFPGATPIKIQDITDGTSNTLFVVDAGDAAAMIWTKPDDWDVTVAFDPKTFSNHHPDGLVAGFADGSVRFLKSAIPIKTLQALVTRKGGEVINNNDL